MPTEENWYAEPFTKRSGCQTPGQCDDDCDCDCSYTSMSDAERLPLIEELAQLFPNEWLAFIVPPEEDDDLTPTHGKLVAHSPHPDDIFDAVNTVLWNQCVYVFFNGAVAAMEASYGDKLHQKTITVAQPVAPSLPSGRVYFTSLNQKTITVAQPVAPSLTPPPPTNAETVPDKLLDLIYSAIDKLYQTPPAISEAVRRLRIAKVRLNYNAESPLHSILDRALDGLEIARPDVPNVIWNLEEALTTFETAIIG